MSLTLALQSVAYGSSTALLGRSGLFVKLSIPIFTCIYLLSPELWSSQNEQGLSEPGMIARNFESYPKKANSVVQAISAGCEPCQQVPALWFRSWVLRILEHSGL